MWGDWFRPLISNGILPNPCLEFQKQPANIFKPLFCPLSPVHFFWWWRFFGFFLSPDSPASLAFLWRRLRSFSSSDDSSELSDVSWRRLLLPNFLKFLFQNIKEN
jgi:hypothetical protein